MNSIIVILVVTSVLALAFVLWRERGALKAGTIRFETPWAPIHVESELGPMTTLSFGGQQSDTLLDTGSLYLMVGNLDDDAVIPTREEQPVMEYHYAGPSAKFRFVLARPRYSKTGVDLGISTVGRVFPSSRKALGVPAVLGLAAVPKWASDTFRQDSFVVEKELEEFWFALQNSRNRRFLLGPPLTRKSRKWLGKLKLHVPITPQIALPTPGLGFLTTALTAVIVRFHGTDTGFRIVRKPAPSNLPRDYVFDYDILNGRSGQLKASEMYLLFDTGTFPALFYADATTRLLGSRVTQSMVSSETGPKDMISGDVTLEFGDYGSITALSVTVPSVYPTALAEMQEIMIVCGFEFQDGNNMRYVIDPENRLPKAVEFYAK